MSCVVFLFLCSQGCKLLAGLGVLPCRWPLFSPLRRRRRGGLLCGMEGTIVRCAIYWKCRTGPISEERCIAWVRWSEPRCTWAMFPLEVCEVVMESFCAWSRCQAFGLSVTSSFTLASIGQRPISSQGVDPHENVPEQEATTNGGGRVWERGRACHGKQPRTEHPSCTEPTNAFQYRYCAYLE
jgi:hypothetical protein